MFTLGRDIIVLVYTELIFVLGRRSPTRLLFVHNWTARLPITNRDYRIIASQVSRTYVPWVCEQVLVSRWLRKGHHELHILARPAARRRTNLERVRGQARRSSRCWVSNNNNKLFFLPNVAKSPFTTFHFPLSTLHCDCDCCGCDTTRERYFHLLPRRAAYYRITHDHGAQSSVAVYKLYLFT